MLPLNRLAFKHKEIQASMPKEKDSRCEENDRSQDGERYSEPNLPEDIWCHIHSLMPLRDSARSACVSHTFMRSWKCHPKLIFTQDALGLKQNACQESDIAKAFTSRVDKVTQNAITPGIEEITLFLHTNYKEEYNFPCSILLNGCGNSIRYLDLSYCALRPTVGFDCLRSLTKLYLYEVRASQGMS
ncbi:hypothetical protein BS78_06G259700 [Paspalum vaginatum]|nr:hypothetical protein BS78_06G259700 [Paspalum vaginatum]